MDSNRCLIFLIFEISLLPKIYSDVYPSLFLMRNQDRKHDLAEKFVYDEAGNVKFSEKLGYDLFNACPEENAPLYETYALQVQALVTDLEASSLQQFVKGDFDKYNCQSPIRPIVLKYIDEDVNNFINQYDIGFLIHDNNGNYDHLWDLYDNFTELREYDFIFFLSVQMDTRSKMIISVGHSVYGQQILESDEVLSPSEPDERYINKYEKNSNEYGFEDVNSLYTWGNQSRRFFLTFHQSYSTYLQYPDQRLIKVQLAPQEDFLFHTWKLATFVELNTTAMWIQLHSQWKRVETFVREAARVYQFGELDVETGAAKVLALADHSRRGRQTSVYLHNDKKFPVAKYFWKLVKLEPLHNQGFTKAILIVMHNDPYTLDQKPICEDVSETYGWTVSNPSHETGLTYVCEVRENITSQLREDFKENYEVFNIKDEKDGESSG